MYVAYEELQIHAKLRMENTVGRDWLDDGRGLEVKGKKAKLSL
jgi:hypothetical protein